MDRITVTSTPLPFNMGCDVYCKSPGVDCIPFVGIGSTCETSAGILLVGGGDVGLCLAFLGGLFVFVSFDALVLLLVSL